MSNAVEPCLMMGEVSLETSPKNIIIQDMINSKTARHFLLDVFQEVRAGPIKSNLPYMASTRCCDLLSQLN